MGGTKAARFADSHPLRMFPTFVWRVELEEDVRRRVNANVLKLVGELREPHAPIQYGHGWQSRQDLHEECALAELIDGVDAATVEVLGYLKIGHSGFGITACWINILAPGGVHGQHRHPNNFLSGVYYVKTQAGADTVNFHDPRPQIGIIRPPVTELTADNTDQVVVKVTDGTLLLFPAWLAHSVDANRSAEERISVSFNMMFAAYTETMSKPLW